MLVTYEFLTISGSFTNLRPTKTEQKLPVIAGKLAYFQLHYQISKEATANKTMSNLVALVNLYGNSPKHLTALIGSPNWPHQFPEWTTFVWLAKTLPGFKLVFEIIDLDIDDSRGNLTLYDGSDRKSPVLFVLTGISFNKTNVYESGYNAILIQFVSKALTKRKRSGFRGRITIDYDIIHFPRVTIVFENMFSRDQHVQVEVYLSDTLQVFSYNFRSTVDTTRMKSRTLYLPGKCCCF